MDADKLTGLVISSIATLGGMTIAAISIIISVPLGMKEKLAKLEAKTKERLAMLEKGIDPMLLLKEPKRAGNDPLLWGLLLTGMGLGILLGYFLYLVTRWDRVVLTNSLAILFGGIGLIIYRLFFTKPDDQRPV
jgi:hypothetical protein